MILAPGQQLGFEVGAEVGCQTGVVGDLFSLNYQGWIVTEQDVLLPVSQAASPLENARLSRDFLRQLGI